MITNGYATVDDYHAYIAVRGLEGAVGADASDDSVIEVLLEAVSRYFDRETGRRFYVDLVDGVYYFEAKDPYEVKLPDFASITTVSVDFNNTRSYTDLATSDYDTLPDNHTADGLPITGLAISPVSTQYFPTQRRGIKVTGKRGWSSVPTDVKDATLAIAQNLNSTRSGQASSGQVSVTAAGVVIRPSDVPEFAQRIIMHYRPKT